MATCERRVYPPDVVKYVKDQLKRVPATRSVQTEIEASDDHAHELPLSMQLTKEMKHNTSLRNALVSLAETGGYLASVEPWPSC